MWSRTDEPLAAGYCALNPEHLAGADGVILLVV
jgi:hypothetical protein